MSILTLFIRQIKLDGSKYLLGHVKKYQRSRWVDKARERGDEISYEDYLE